MSTTLKEMLEDLLQLVAKHGEQPVLIYCANCECEDTYNGAVSDSMAITIVINKED